jgi:hypothetical protein
MTTAVSIVFGLIVLVGVVSRGSAEGANNVSCYTCVSTNYRRTDPICWESSFDEQQVALVSGCKCCRKAISLSGTVQRECILPRFDPHDVFCQPSNGNRNYICNTDGCNGAGSLRHHRGLVLASLAAMLASAQSALCRA